MPDDQNQRKVFDFFAERFRTQSAFTRDDVQAAVPEWSASSFETYWSKQFKQFVIAVHGSNLRMSEVFRRFADWERFKKHVTQVRTVSSDYTTLTYDNVIIYEFFMPLANEEHLRTSLDALFFRDTLSGRLKGIGLPTLREHFPSVQGEDDDAYMARLLAWVAGRFGGYSISHVSGRYKGGPLLSIAEAASLEEKGGRYLIDETTAVARFIFPCGDPERRLPPLTSEHFVHGAANPSPGAEAEADLIRWFFGVLFVQSIVQVINGEAEIWMYESGMRSRLHIWRVET